MVIKAVHDNEHAQKHELKCPLRNHRPHLIPTSRADPAEHAKGLAEGARPEEYPGQCDQVKRDQNAGPSRDRRPPKALGKMNNGDPEPCRTPQNTNVQLAPCQSPPSAIVIITLTI